LAKREKTIAKSPKLFNGSKENVGDAARRKLEREGKSFGVKRGRGRKRVEEMEEERAKESETRGMEGLKEPLMRKT
jgi:hypothetical protein